MFGFCGTLFLVTVITILCFFTPKDVSEFSVGNRIKNADYVRFDEHGVNLLQGISFIIFAYMY